MISTEISEEVLRMANVPEPLSSFPSDWDSVQQGTFCVSLEAWINVFPSSTPCNRESSYDQSFLPSQLTAAEVTVGVRKPMFTLQCKKRSRSPLGKNWG